MSLDWFAGSPIRVRAVGNWEGVAAIGRRYVRASIYDDGMGIGHVIRYSLTKSDSIEKSSEVHKRWEMVIG